ncbi:MAG: NUDIX domain-containing protein [Chloroflexi bacterium]|nr:NUDIX domain-containing protein [Chloroflexota bacterium]
MSAREVVSAVLYNARGEVLLQLRDDKPHLPFANHWTLFGGHVEAGETPDEAIARELWEELTLKLPLTRWRSYVCPVRSVDGVSRTTNHVYRGELRHDHAALTLREGQAMRYFTPREAANITLAFGQIFLLHEFFGTKLDE